MRGTEPEARSKNTVVFEGRSRSALHPQNYERNPRRLCALQNLHSNNFEVSFKFRRCPASDQSAIKASNTLPVTGPPASQHSHNPLSLRYTSFCPLVMRHHLIFVPFFLVSVPLVVLATPHSPHWDDMRSKHSWSAVPEDWECSGPPPIGTTLNLHVALKPRRENALNHAFYEVSTPGNPKYVFSVTLFLTHVLMCLAAPMQISCTSLQRADRRTCRSTSGHSPARPFLARVPRSTLLFHLSVTRWRLAEDQWGARTTSQRSSWRIVPAVQARQD